MRVVRLLLVDDEARFVETLSKRLTARGFDVEGALGGPQALEMLDARPFDVVLLDVWMPGMDGLEVLKAIRRLHPSVKVVLLSGNASIDAAVEGMRLGAANYLLKPVEIDELLAKVEEAFEKKRIEEDETDRSNT
jgi:DNA-binding NtrC family response regulator